MYNWSGTDLNKFVSVDQRQIWQLEQAINFGLNDTKLSIRRLKKYWPQLNIDPAKKIVLDLFLRHETSTTHSA